MADSTVSYSPFSDSGGGVPGLAPGNSAAGSGMPAVALTAATAGQATPAPHLARTMSLVDGLGIVIGIMIGSGIFASSGDIVADAGSPGLALIAWVVAGGLVMLSLMSYAELGTCLPSAGGETLYFFRAFGPSVSFSYVWTQYFVLNTGSQAIICTVFARYFGYVVFGNQGLDEDVDTQLKYKLLAAGALIVLNVTNVVFGTKVGNAMQNVLTATKVLLALLCSLVGLYHMAASPATVDENLGGKAFDGSTFTGFAKAIVGALWAFDGFSYGVYFAEDLKRPKQLPLILIGYFAVLSFDVITKSSTIGIDFAKEGIASWGGTLLALGVSLSAFGSANGSIMSGARIYWSAARGGQFPKVLKYINSKNAPVTAHLAQCVWSLIVLTFPFSFSGLLSYFAFAAWVFYGLSSVAVIRLRYTEPGLRRPFRTPGYPWVPGTAALLAAVLVIALAAEDPVPSLGALAFVLLSLPVYYVGSRCGKITFKDAEDLGLLAEATPAITSTAYNPTEDSESDPLVSPDTVRVELTPDKKPVRQRREVE